MTTAEDLLADLNRLMAESPAGYTAAELSGQWVVSIGTTRQRIKKLMAAGRMEFAGHRREQRSDTQWGQVPVYRVKANRK